MSTIIHHPATAAPPQFTWRPVSGSPFDRSRTATVTTPDGRVDLVCRHRLGRGWVTTVTGLWAGSPWTELSPLRTRGRALAYAEAMFAPGVPSLTAAMREGQAARANAGAPAR